MIKMVCDAILPLEIQDQNSVKTAVCLQKSGKQELATYTIHNLLRDGAIATII
jgi:hypothetical protein